MGKLSRALLPSGSLAKLHLYEMAGKGGATAAHDAMLSVSATLATTSCTGTPW